jgi:hypothetical protein
VIEMRYLLSTLTGLLVGAGLLAGLFWALPASPRTSDQAASKATAMPHMSGAMAMSGSATMASSSLATTKLTIQHVQRGCHVWSNGTTTGPIMRLHLKPGQKLSILDQDVDPHQMIELAGPMHLHMGGPMMMGHGMAISFMKKGIYRLGTKTVEMAGGGMDVKTIGPDNHLRLVVTVA